MEQEILVPEIEGSSVAEMRSKILALESAIKQMPERLIEIKTTHHFAPGVYAREIFIPKGTTLTGKIHKTEHLNIVSLGDITVWTEDGMRRVRAPATILSKPGMKRAGYAHEDTVWITVHPSEERDLEKLEELLIAKDFSEIPGLTKQLLGGA